MRLLPGVLVFVALLAVAAAFLVGRASVRPAPGEPGRANATEPAATEGTPRRGGGETTTTRPARPPAPEERVVSSTQVFAVPTRETSPPPVPERPAASASETPRANASDTLNAQMARCLTLTATRDDSATMVFGVRVAVEVRNACGTAFAGADVDFEVRAFPISGAGTAAHATGVFQTTIPSLGSAETLIALECDPERRYRFEASLVRPRGP